MKSKETYSIKDIIQNLHEYVTDRFDNPNTGVYARLDKIDTKQAIANGRVGKLESWRQFLLGAWAVLTILTPIAWYIIIKQIDQYGKNIDNEINVAVGTALKNNVESIKYAQ